MVQVDSSNILYTKIGALRGAFDKSQRELRTLLVVHFELAARVATAQRKSEVVKPGLNYDKLRSL